MNQKRPKSDRLRLGVLSTAKIGLERVLPAANAAQEVEVVALASRSLDRARAAADQLGIAKAYGSYEALLADPNVDAVYNPLPNTLHAPWTIAAAEAGKHVLCEKPLAVSVGEAQEMASACSKRGVVLMEAFMYRHHPQHAVGRAFFDREDVGRLRQIRASFSFFHAAPRGNIRFMPELEGGALMDVGCYAINAARWISGSEPVAVHAIQRVSIEFGVDVSVSILLEFSDDLVATLDVGFDRIGGGKYEMAGEHGTVTVENAFTPGVQPVGVTLRLSDRVETVQVAAVNQYTLELDHFATCILQGRPLAPAEDGVKNTAVVDAVRTAMREQRRVEVAQM